MSRWIYYLPFLAVIFLSVIFYLSLDISQQTNHITDYIIHEPLPRFTLSEVEGIESGFNTQDILHTLEEQNAPFGFIVFFASWCPTCHINHETLKALKQQTNYPIWGIAIKETPERLQKWFATNENLYQQIGFDDQKEIALSFVVKAIPTVFIIDKTGYIRYRHDGAITSTQLENHILPLLVQLKKEF